MLNEVLLKKQEELVSQMKKVADVFTRLESEGFDFLHGFKVVGDIEFYKTLLDDENLDESKLSGSEAEEFEKWQFLSEESETQYWSLVFDSDTGDFMPLSKLLLSKARIYLSGDNLATIKSSSLTCSDPENTAWNYPHTASFTFGIQVGF